MGMVSELRERLPVWMTPGVAMGAINFVAIIFCGGMVWASTQGDIKNNKTAIDDLRAEVRLIRSLDTSTSVAVLKTDVQYIKDSLIRIEGRLDGRPVGRP